jgi:phosphatidylglycerophosphate synthase
LDEKISRHEAFNANMMTLAQLQLMVQATDIKSPRFLTLRKYGVATILDAGDGMYARLTGTASPEGAVIDVVTDRLADLVLVNTIVTELNKFDPQPYLESQLATACLLSTLTKAACEMANIKTEEGKAGSMMERRKVFAEIFSILKKLKPNSDNKKKIDLIDQKIELVICHSQEAARERVGKLPCGTWWNNNEKLENPMSAAAVEARKYTQIIIMAARLGIDMNTELDRLSLTKLCPKPGELKFQYISKSGDMTKDYIDRALDIIS